MAPKVSRRHFETLVTSEFARQPLTPPQILEAEDLAALPDPVVRYLRLTGAVGRPVPRDLRIEFDAVMRRRPGDPGMAARSVQYNFLGDPARYFFMRARMFGLSVAALHAYRKGQAEFTVRVASAFTMVNQRGSDISRSETVTVLNDLCVFAPGALIDHRLRWEPIDDSCSAVTFVNGPPEVHAELIFDAQGDLADFRSDDRPDSSSGRFVPMRWNTPLGDHRQIGGVRVPTSGATIYARPDGPFTYGEFRLRSLAYNLGDLSQRTS